MQRTLVRRRTCFFKAFHSKLQDLIPVNSYHAHNGVVQAIGRGDVVVAMKTLSGTKKGVLTSVLHVPKLTRNLFSVSRFTKTVASVTLDTSNCHAQYQESEARCSN